MKTCKAHIKGPAFIYRDCPGCEIQAMRDEITKLRADNAALTKERDKLSEDVRGLLEDFEGAL